MKLVFHFDPEGRIPEARVRCRRPVAGGRIGLGRAELFPYDGRLYNQIAVDHSQSMFGATPILVLDMYEHAYHLEFGSDAAAYVDVFMRIIEWRVAAERLVRRPTTRGRRGSRDAAFHLCRGAPHRHAKRTAVPGGRRATEKLRVEGRGGLAAWYGAGGARAVRDRV